MQNVYSKDRNLEVWVGTLTFKNFGNFIGHKSELTKDDLNEFNKLARCIKKLPNEVGKMVMLKYVKLATFKPSTRKEIKFTDPAVERYNIRQADHVKVAEALGITAKEVSKLDNEAYELMADYLMEEELQKHKLVKKKFVDEQIVDKNQVIVTIMIYKKNFVDVK